ncbi:LLM class flavin-dependent oxidoreductase [Enterobacter sp. AD2-3]|uniref:LLM class flavin-dependent oxidoreductase n=1 Tax=Enterobacter sp. AD2-3 TaxID=2547834 RepID=UPI001058AB63|nr:LLM class flavin-dependent oxidoreductase [Enterobacter sp. AD2-3]QBN08529.1 LLM class flavin-dependent oxidoreductase [Enterobacter cloacae complex sp.]THC25516.1 LLM class flavin-dependent oxidoreductase [Enterobacter sp. AD2-3]
MQTVPRQMHLGAFLPAPGHHVAAWRHPNAQPNGGLDINYYSQLARTAERGKFDLMFLSDGVGVRTHYKDEDELSRWGRTVHFEPLTLLSALSMVTQRLGLIATASTSYNEPFHIARKFASLDYLSNGRAGWNVVTSVTDVEAQNFNLEKQADHATRYQRAREFMNVVSGLWDSWDDDAFLYDKASGRYFDPSRLRILNHKDSFFSVRGPLNVARPPQGYPVIVQAGSSADGQDFAAQWAEVIFTAHQTLEQAQHFYSGIKQQVEAHGRSPEQAVVMPGVFTVVGKTQSEAEDKYAQLQELVDPVVGMGLLTGLLGDVDISGYPLDGPLPELPTTEGSTSRQQLVYEQARREGLTIRQLYLSVAGGRGHRFILGSPSQIADQLEEWFVSNGADGFNIMPPCLPDGLNDFVDLVIPELQRRHLFRTEYTGTTLREHLGLKRPQVRPRQSNN